MVARAMPALGLLLVLVRVGCAGPGGSSDPVDADGLRGNSDMADVLKMLPAIAEPARKVTLSAPTPGVLMEILVHEGEQVEAGQALAIMDNRVAVAELRLAEAAARRGADLALARLELELAESVLSRIVSIDDREAVSELEIDQARNNRDKARAALQRARQQAEQARLNMELARARADSYEIRAPFSGRVLRIDGRVGQTFDGEEDLISIADLKRLRVELFVPIAWYGKLRPGDTCQLAASPPVNRRMSATLLACEPIVDAATQTFRCTLQIDNRDVAIPAGFAVRLVRPDEHGEVASHRPSSAAGDREIH